MPESKVETITVEQIMAGLRTKPLDLALVGNPRYKPKSMIPYWGYDNTAKFLFDVEWALWKVLAKLEIMPEEAGRLLTAELYKEIRDRITTTLQDEIENSITHHDVRALVRAIEEIVVQLIGEFQAKLLTRWTHFAATSYDIIDTARMIAYKLAFRRVTLSSLWKLISSLKTKIESDQIKGKRQIGRTHGIHAEPITLDFWLATILARLLDVAEHLIVAESELTGKFSGVVGACNSQVVFGLEEKAQTIYGKTFEELILGELGLKPAPISTQIVPPEPLSRFLFEYVLLSGAMAQMATDCRNLQRSEINEVLEFFADTQVGSSAMSHKRNPIKMEGVMGIFLIVKDEFAKVLDALFSEHQRFGVTMSVAREFPGIIVLVQHQLETMNKVVPQISINYRALERNFNMNSHLILSEEVYMALVMAGYEGDAHELVNHTLVPRSQVSGAPLIDELILLAKEDDSLASVVKNIPDELKVLLRSPEQVVGKAEEKAKEIIMRTNVFNTNYHQILAEA